MKTMRPTDSACATRAQAGLNTTWQPLASSHVSLHHVSYVHVPKSGSGFANIIFRAACRAKTTLPFLEPHEVHCIVRRHCPDAFVSFDWGHAPLQQPLLPTTMAVTLMRAPWRRVLSGFFANLHDCPWLQTLANVTEHRPTPATAPFYTKIAPAHVKAYATCVGGCATRMLTGHLCGGGQRAVASEAALAPQALVTLRRFAFVGVTDEWTRSLTAFSRAFNVDVVASDAAVRRPGARPASDAAARVEAIVKAAKLTDAPLYAEALSILSEIERGTWAPAQRGAAR